MNYGINDNLLTTHNECLVIGVFKDNNVPQALMQTKQHAPVITQLLSKLTEDNETLWQTACEGPSLLLIHCGNRDDFNARQLQKKIGVIADQLLQKRIISATLCLPEAVGLNTNQQLEYMLLQFDAKCYQLLDFKQIKKPHALSSIDFYLPNSTTQALSSATAIASCIRLTKDLANLPANVATPSYLAEKAKELVASDDCFSLKILERADMESLGMGALLAVARGSHEAPKFIEIHYQKGEKTAPIVLIGKGVTFDSGGISLKPSDGMQEMKYDMAGAASVLATLKACSLLELNVSLIGLIPCTENMPGGSAVKPGDIVRSLSGQTIEIINTDAEGRLLLADALTYAEQFKPQWVLDIATLTGAAKVALGSVNSAYMTNDEDLAELIANAAKRSQDKAWRLPLEDEYQESINSFFADIANSTFERFGGSITAACFLSRFSKQFRWAHLDIAGSAWLSGAKASATGRPVPLLIELIRHAAHSG